MGSTCELKVAKAVDGGAQEVHKQYNINYVIALCQLESQLECQNGQLEAQDN